MEQLMSKIKRRELPVGGNKGCSAGNWQPVAKAAAQKTVRLPV